MSKSVIPTTAAIFVALLVFYAPAAVAKTEKTIKMTFDIEGGALTLKKGGTNTTPSNCAKKDHDGCYDIPKNYYGAFELILKKGDNTCGDDDDWKFHSVVLGGESDVSNPSDKPAAWGNISADAAEDFGADETTGEVTLTHSSKKKVTYRSENDHSFSIWYKVSVEKCGDGQILEYDPRVDNRG